MDPPMKYSRSYKRLSLGMPKAGIPFFINNHRFFSWYYIFISLHIMCCSWSVGLFLLSVCLCQFSDPCNNSDPCMLWERDTLRFFIIHSCASLICVECLAFDIYASSSCFSSISCSRAVSFCSQEVLLLLLHPFSFVSNKLIGVW